VVYSNNGIDHLIYHSSQSFLWVLDALTEAPHPSNLQHTYVGLAFIFTFHNPKSLLLENFSMSHLAPMVLS